MKKIYIECFIILRNYWSEKNNGKCPETGTLRSCPETGTLWWYYENSFGWVMFDIGSFYYYEYAHYSQSHFPELSVRFCFWTTVHWKDLVLILCSLIEKYEFILPDFRKFRFHMRYITHTKYIYAFVQYDFWEKPKLLCINFNNNTNNICNSNNNTKTLISLLYFYSRNGLPEELYYFSRKFHELLFVKSCVCKHLLRISGIFLDIKRQIISQMASYEAKTCKLDKFLSFTSKHIFLHS